MSKIDKTIHKIQKSTEKAGSSGKQEGLETSGEIRQVKFPGDPNCPICGGIGYLRRDLPIDHPDFGKMVPCSCRSEEITQSARTRLFRMSSLEALKNLRFDNFEKRGHVGLGK
jgi:DNA replication protein DnaC